MVKTKVAGITFQPTETHKFKDGNKTILIHVENSIYRFRWQLEVNGNKSAPFSYYPGILKHRGYCVATAYWEGTFPVFIPFSIHKVAEVA